VVVYFFAVCAACMCKRSNISQRLYPLVNMCATVYTLQLLLSLLLGLLCKNVILGGFQSLEFEHDAMLHSEE
jgi:hypothetical protein